MLTFDPVSHTYRWLGKIVPNVTSLLRGLYSFANVPSEVLEAAQQRGTYVHTACHFLDEDDLDLDELRVQQPDIWNYVQGYKRFLLDCEPNYAGIEERVYHEALGYAGCLDRRGELNYKGERITSAVIDIKTSVQAHPIVWEPQLAAYAHASGHPTARRFTLQLRTDRTYRLLEWTNPSAWPTFMSLLTLQSWSRQHDH